MTDEYANQPPISEWKFIEQLKSPIHAKTVWRRLKKKKNEACLKNGVSLEFNFSDAGGGLDTAYDDFRKFLAAGQIGTNGKYRIITDFAKTSCFEEYIIDADKNSCRLLANDTEGIRRALVFIEDMISGTGGPFLPFCKIKRKPFIKTRVSRCFFGPIKRPPMNRDELMDDVSYYPDEYLNRLVHEGINGLWLSIEFRDLCPSGFFPTHGRDSEKRLEKLRATVRQCARYGIKIYVYCNEPMGFGDSPHSLPMSELEGNPWFSGHKDATGNWTYFCTSSKEGGEYLEECSNHIFSNVPRLGGMICITHGERITNCYSHPHILFANNCPRCSKRKPYEVYHDTLSAIARGIKRAAPEAEFISWLYMPALVTDNLSTMEQKFEVFRQIAAHTPKDVTMQMNFESNGKVSQLGREFTAYDYWLAYPGPSGIFSDCASKAIKKAGARVSAKIQVGCSHENASIPFMPVPGSLYRKYRAMKKLGVSAVMQCWYFGSYPGLMNKAAGELSFEPFMKSEDEFLEALARVDWAGNQKKVASAWKYFMHGYSNFPITLSFTWFGPLHCSIVWPLHLFPVDRPIAPSWEFGYPDSGDRIGECVCFNYSLGDILKLLKAMDDNWRKGIAILSSIENDYAENIGRQMDMGLYRAIGLQIRSSRNAFTFYDIREQLPFMKKTKCVGALKKMEEIVLEEIDNCKAMKQLCLKDPRLGFHSEAEGYKFFPAKLDWRAGLLEKLLAKDFPKVAAEIENGNELFPEYTGVKPEGATYYCGEKQAEATVVNFDDKTGSWKAWCDAKRIHFEARWTKKSDAKEVISLIVEPRRLWPFLRFDVFSNGEKSFYHTVLGKEPEWTVTTKADGIGLVSIFSIPFKSIPWHDGRRPLRINIRQADSAQKYLCGWVKQHPLKSRLLFEDHNSADLGWIFFPEN